MQPSEVRGRDLPDVSANPHILYAPVACFFSLWLRLNLQVVVHGPHAGHSTCQFRYPHFLFGGCDDTVQSDHPAFRIHVDTGKIRQAIGG